MSRVTWQIHEAACGGSSRKRPATGASAVELDRIASFGRGATGFPCQGEQLSRWTGNRPNNQTLIYARIDLWRDCIQCSPGRSPREPACNINSCGASNACRRLSDQVQLRPPNDVSLGYIAWLKDLATRIVDLGRGTALASGRPSQATRGLPTSLPLFQASRDCSVFMAHSRKKDGSFMLNPRSGEGSQSCPLLSLEYSQPE